MSDNAVVDLQWLCNWLEDNSSGAYRPCKEAAHVIRTMHKEIQELKNSKDSDTSLFEKERVVMCEPPRLGIATLCRLMDDCLPEQVEDERDMQELIDKLWPALVCEFEVDT